MLKVTHGLTQLAERESESAIFFTVEVDGVHAEILQYLIKTYGKKSTEYMKTIVVCGFEDVLQDEVF